MHWSSRTEERWPTHGHIEHDGLCDICGGAWPCPNVPLAPYDPEKPAPDANRQGRAGARPAVYGYVRSTQRGRARLRQWQTDLHSFCQQAGLRLVYCFCSMGRPQTGNIGEYGPSLVRPYITEVYDTDPARPITMATAQPTQALRVLLTILEQRPTYGVVVPSIFHFATERKAALALMQHIERLGTKVMIAPVNRTTNIAITNPNNHALPDAPIEPNRPVSNGYYNGGRA